MCLPMPPSWFSREGILKIFCFRSTETNLWPNIWPRLENGPRALEKNMHSADWWGALCLLHLGGLGVVFVLCLLPSFFLFINDFIYLFLERGEGKEKERERNISVWLSFACPLLGTWPTTQACALMGNRTADPVLCSPALNPLSHTSQGCFLIPVWLFCPLLRVGY